MLGRLSGEVFDLVVAGGGATGCGVALDAASRGLKVALVEKGDFGSGTSGRSSKLLHGGVRYLERAVLHLDRDDFKLVREALAERSILLRLAPHLCRRIPLVVPIYQSLQLVYVRAGLILYDTLAGAHGIGVSRTLDPDEVLRYFPLLRREGLKGGVLYYDGQFDDARMNLALALTAIQQGAVAANYVEAVAVLHEDGRVAGLRLRDRWSGREWDVRARCVVNACGPGVDLLRRLDQPDAAPLLTPSAGSHLVFPGVLTPEGAGITIPKTPDGRVLFVLPWHGGTLVGTTDHPAAAGEPPAVDRGDVRYLLEQVTRYFQLDRDSARVLSSWAGIRPLVGDSTAVNTASLHRDHLIDRSPSGLVTITGGKWTTYRKMAQDTVDVAVRDASLPAAGKCRTDSIQLQGGEGYRDDAWTSLMVAHGLTGECARHFNGSYGSRAGAAAAYCQGRLAEPLVAGHPFVKGEVVYAVKEEMALTCLDFLERRSGLLLMDVAAAREAAGTVAGLMAAELGWDESRMAEERQSVLDWK
nr:FAD-dependent oxidoreductase [Geomonas sp. Red32]